MKTFQTFLEQKEPLVEHHEKMLFDALVQAVKDTETKHGSKGEIAPLPRWVHNAKIAIRMGEEEGLGEPSEKEWGPLDRALRI
jgi:hypothetical protein